MRLLFITAFYPPYEIGGWEQNVRDLNHLLRQNGYETRVLTSSHGVQHPSREPGVDRVLHLETDIFHYRPTEFVGYRRKVKANIEATTEVIESFQPDIAFVHVMHQLTWAVPHTAENLLPGRVVYYMANSWPNEIDPHASFWKSPARSGLRQAAKTAASVLPLRTIKNEMGRYQLKFEHVMCVSRAILEDLAENAGIPRSHLTVVHNGVETDLFRPGLSADLNEKRPLRLVFAGSLFPHKGVHTAIESLKMLDRQGRLQNSHLTIIGSGHPDYENQLRDLVSEMGLSERIHFHGRVPREQMPALLPQFDIMIFPSIWNEPLSRGMQEGMAAGLAVVGTLTGGTGELLVEGKTGLTFRPSDASHLAERLHELDRDRPLLQRLAAAGRRAVEERFTLNRMLTEMDAYFHRVLAIYSNQS